MLKKALSFLLVIALLSGCTKPQTLTKYSNQTIEAGFDTIITLIGYTKDKAEFDAYFEIMKNEFARLNELFDKYNDYEGVNNIKTINDNAGIAPVVVDQAILDMLKLAKEWYEPSGGSFNVTMGSVLEIWHEYRDMGQADNSDGKPGEVPPLHLLEEANVCTGWQFVEIDESAKTVYINNACSSLDVGGIAKGFATEIVARLLVEEGLKAGIVNAGGNVRLINTKPDGAKWAVGIQSPDIENTSESLDTLYADKSMSVVTSGDYQRYYIGPDDVVYHHLIDPSTLYPARQARSVTILIEDSGLADTLAKPLFILPYDQALAFLEKFNEDHPDVFMGAVWVYDKGMQPAGTQAIDVGEFSLVHSENIKPYSRLYNE